MRHTIQRAARTIALFSAFAMSANSQESPEFNGHWELNREQSDDLRAKMREMREKMMEERGGGGRGGMGGGGRGGMGGGGRGGMGGGSRGGMGGGGRGGGRGGSGGGGGRSGGMAGGALAQPETLDIEWVELEFHVDDGHTVAVFYVDGESTLR